MVWYLGLSVWTGFWLYLLVVNALLIKMIMIKKFEIKSDSFLLVPTSDLPTYFNQYNKYNITLSIEMYKEPVDYPIPELSVKYDRFLHVKRYILLAIYSATICYLVFRRLRLKYNYETTWISDLCDVFLAVSFITNIVEVNNNLKAKKLPVSYRISFDVLLMFQIWTDFVWYLWIKCRKYNWQVILYLLFIGYGILAQAYKIICVNVLGNQEEAYIRKKLDFKDW